jgi:ABC-type multidrug transport system fused ATPase/permease subunit
VHKQALTASFIAFTSGVGLGAFILVIWYGSSLVISGELSVGDLVAFMLYSTQIGASIGMMAGLVGSLFVAQGASKRTFQLIDRVPKIPALGGNGLLDPDFDDDVDLEQELYGSDSGGSGGVAMAVVKKAPNNKRSVVAAAAAAAASGGAPTTTNRVLRNGVLSKAVSPFKGVIEFDNVSFAYPSRLDVPVLKDLTLAIPQNATFAFVGSSGAGKSTVLQLIERFYEPTSGLITIDGHDLSKLDPRYLRRHVALVAQEPVLFGEMIETTANQHTNQHTN